MIGRGNASIFFAIVLKFSSFATKFAVCPYMYPSVIKAFSTAILQTLKSGTRSDFSARKGDRIPSLSYDTSYRHNELRTCSGNWKDEETLDIYISEIHS